MKEYKIGRNIKTPDGDGVIVGGVFLNIAANNNPYFRKYCQISNIDVNAFFRIVVFFEDKPIDKQFQTYFTEKGLKLYDEYTEEDKLKIEGKFKDAEIQESKKQRERDKQKVMNTQTTAINKGEMDASGLLKYKHNNIKETKEIKPPTTIEKPKEPDQPSLFG